MPFMYNSATADLGILEGRLTPARAAALDELLAANIPTDLTNIAAQNVAVIADIAANLVAIGLVETEANAAARFTTVTNAIDAIQVWADYHYYIDLAGAATYTPPAQTLATFLNEFGQLDEDEMSIEFWDGGGWFSAINATPMQVTAQIFQDAAQNVRIINNGAQMKISLTGVVWT